MCNCAYDRTEQLKNKFYPDAESASIQNIDLFSGKLFSEVEIKLPKQKKPKKINFLYSHCPFCGELYEAEKGGEDR